MRTETGVSLQRAVRRPFIEAAGKTHTVLSADEKRVLLPYEERARCEVCRKRKNTVVNGVCIEDGRQPS